MSDHTSSLTLISGSCWAYAVTSSVESAFAILFPLLGAPSINASVLLSSGAAANGQCGGGDPATALSFVAQQTQGLEGRYAGSQVGQPGRTPKALHTESGESSQFAGMLCEGGRRQKPHAAPRRGHLPCSF